MLSTGITAGRDEAQDTRILKVEHVIEEIVGLGSDDLISRLEKVDAELDFVRKQYKRKWRYILIDWYRSQL